MAQAIAVEYLERAVTSALKGGISELASYKKPIREVLKARVIAGVLDPRGVHRSKALMKDGPVDHNRACPC